MGPKNLGFGFWALIGDSWVSYGNLVIATTGELALTYKTKHYDFNGDFICDMHYYVIYMNWLNHVICGYVPDSLCDPYMWTAMCLQFYDLMWFMTFINLVYDYVL